MVNMDLKNIRFIGRHRIEGSQVYLAFSGCGFEFVLKPINKTCIVSFEFLSLLNECGSQYVTVYIEDKIYKTYEFKQGLNRIEFKIDCSKPNLKIRVIKENEVYLSTLYLRETNIDGGKIVESKEAKKKVGFFGDSLTCGYGLTKRYEPEFSMETERFTKAFSYLVANKLDLDYIVVARSGIGLSSKLYSDVLFEEIVQTIDMRDYYPLEDDLDLAIINLGTNDHNYFLLLDDKNRESFMDMFIKKYVDLIKTILEHNKGIKVLICYNLAKIDDEFASTFRKVTTIINKQYPKTCYLLKVESDNSGAGNHPYCLAHSKAATRIVNKIKKYKLL